MKWSPLLLLLALAGCGDPPPDPPFAAKLLRPAEGELPAPLRGLAVSADGERVATFTIDTVQVRAAGGEMLGGFQYDGVTSLAFAPAGDILAAGTGSGVVVLLAGTTSHYLQATKTASASVRFAPDGRTLLSWGRDAILWDVAKREVVSRIEGDCVAVSRDARAVLVRREGLALVDAPTGLARWSSGEPASAAAFTEDGARCAIGTKAGAVEVRDARSGAVLGRASGFEGGVRSLAFSPDASLLVASPRSGDGTRLLDAVTLQDVRLLRWQHGARAFSPDSTKLLAVVGGEWAVLSDVKTGAELAELWVGRARSFAAAFSPDGRYLAIESGYEGDPSMRSEVRFFDVAASRKLALVEGSSLVFTKDSRRAVWLRAPDGIVCVADAPR